MTEQAADRSTTDWLLDLCVFAPLGLVFEAQKYLPELAQRGRGHLGMAKVLGQIAVDRLEKEFGPLGAALRTGSRGYTAPWCAAPPQADDPTQTRTQATEADATSPAEAVFATEAAQPAGGAASAPDKLAIGQYATRTVAQIVPLLRTLGRADLEAIGCFERANRARRGILSRVDQLLGER